MARVEMRKPIDTLTKEKNVIELKLTELKDKFDLAQTQLQDLRNEQFAYREGKASLSNTASNNAAKRVFDEKIKEAQKKVEELSNVMNDLEKDRTVWTSKYNAITKSIKELQSA